MSKKLIATVLVIGYIAGKRVEFNPGVEVTGLSTHDVEQLKRLGSLRDLDAEQADTEADKEKRAAAAKLFEEARAKVTAAQDSIRPPDVKAEQPSAQSPATAPVDAGTADATVKPKKGKARQEPDADGGDTTTT